MQRIERYGVIAMVLLLVTIVAVSFWEDRDAANAVEREQRAGRDLVARVEGRANAPRGTANRSPSAPSRTIDRNLPVTAPNDNRAARHIPAPEPKPIPRASEPVREGYLSPIATRGAGSAEDDFRMLPPRETESSRPVHDQLWDRDEGGQLYGSGDPDPRRESSPVDASEAGSPPPAVRFLNAPESTDTQTIVPVSDERTPVPRTAAATYTVRPGDTLSQISERSLGTSKRWMEIQELNGISDPSKIYEGLVLRLPTDAVVRSTPPVQPAVNTSRAAPVATPPSSGKTYLVKSGDMLSTIAQRELGSASAWPRIAALNPEIDPDHVIEGTRLRMPARASSDSRVARTTPAPTKRNRVR